MTVWHFFVIVSLNGGAIYFDDWAYQSKAECEEKHARIETILATDDDAIKGVYLTNCEKITLPIKG